MTGRAGDANARAKSPRCGVSLNGSA